MCRPRRAMTLCLSFALLSPCAGATTHNATHLAKVVKVITFALPEHRHQELFTYLKSDWSDRHDDSAPQLEKSLKLCRWRIDPTDVTLRKESLRQIDRFLDHLTHSPLANHMHAVRRLTQLSDSIDHRLNRRSLPDPRALDEHIKLMINELFGRMSGKERPD